jgi:hypothetical protein
MTANASGVMAIVIIGTSRHPSAKLTLLAVGTSYRREQLSNVGKSTATAQLAVWFVRRRKARCERSVGCGGLPAAEMFVLALACFLLVIIAVGVIALLVD